jgi:3D (Asp-Asp-Asp) domain-containing protein
MTRSFLILFACAAGCLALISCVENPARQLLVVENYGDASTHAGVDIEKAQGITRQADGWIVGDGARYRIVFKNQKPWLEWKVGVSNITDMPRRASCSIVASFNNYAGGLECLPVLGGGQVVLAPNSAGEICGSAEAPNKDLMAFSRRIVLPMSAPRAEGPIAIRCLQIKDGQAIITWKATVSVIEHQFTITYTDSLGKRIVQKQRIAVDRYLVEAILYDQDGKEIDRDKQTVTVDKDRLALAEGKISMPLDKAADIGKVAVQWKEAPDENAKPQSEIKGKVRRMCVTAYCPCGKCCNKPGGADGVTAWGTDAFLPGVAADRMYAFGRMLDVPGYGQALVDDRGGRIRGPDRLDVRFPDHNTARRFGVKYLDITWMD